MNKVLTQKEQSKVGPTPKNHGRLDTPKHHIHHQNSLS